MSEEEPILLERFEPSEKMKRARITLHFQLHHEYPGDQPTSVQCVPYDWLESDEEPYSRRIVVGEHWQEIEQGWLGTSGMLFIENQEGRGRQTIPSKEEAADTAKRVVEISFYAKDANVWTLRPGWPFFGFTKTVKAVRLRCQHKTAKCRVIIFPR